MTPELTIYDVDAAGVALLRLDRPDARNALNTTMLTEILGHLAAARDEASVRVLVLSSTDHMALSAGADVRESWTPTAGCGAWSCSRGFTTS